MAKLIGTATARRRNRKRALRRHLVSAGAGATAGVVALTMVVVPPDVGVPTIEHRQVRLAAFPLPDPSVAVVLQRLVGAGAGAGGPVVKVVPVDPADLPAGAVAIRTTDSTAPAGTPAADRQAVSAAAVAPTAALAIPEALLPIVGPIILFAPIFAVALLILPFTWPTVLAGYIQSAILFIGDLLGGALFAAAPLAVAASPYDATVSATDEPEQGPPGGDGTAVASSPDHRAVESSGEPAVTEEDESAGDAVAVEPREAAVMAQTEPVAETADPAEIADAAVDSEDAADPAAVSAPEADDTPRPVVRESLRADDPSPAPTATDHSKDDAPAAASTPGTADDAPDADAGDGGSDGGEA